MGAWLSTFLTYHSTEQYMTWSTAWPHLSWARYYVKNRLPHIKCCSCNTSGEWCQNQAAMALTHDRDSKHYMTSFREIKGLHMSSVVSRIFLLSRFTTIKRDKEYNRSAYKEANNKHHIQMAQPWQL